MNKIKLLFLPTCFITGYFMLSLLACNNAASPAGPAGSDTAIQAAAPASLPVLDQLTGTWQNENGKSFERWTRNDTGTYRSVVFAVKGIDTSRQEEAHVYQQNGKWVFANKVSGQNEGKTIEFTATVITGNSILFSNPAHDFPTDINYTVTDANTLNAFIAGPNGKGGKDTIPFNYIRVR